MTRAEELKAIERAIAEGKLTKLKAVSSPDLGRVNQLGHSYLAPVPSAGGPFFTGGYRAMPKRSVA